MGNFRSKFQIPDLYLFSVVLMLSAFGLIMVYSASSVIAMDQFGDSWHYFRRQLVFFVLGLGAMFCVMNIPYERIVKLGPLAIIVSLIALCLVFIPGMGVRSGLATRWLDFGFVGFQPAEFAKLAVILFATSKIVRPSSAQVGDFFSQKILVPIVSMTFLLCLLVFLQPDFGSATILLTLMIFVLYFAGLKLRYIFGSLFLLMPIFIVLLLGQDYRRKRILAFLDPWDDPQNLGYQIVQSFVAFFSGGFWGVGLGNSQEKLYFLPEAHTDFIFAVIGEELGFAGVLFVLVCYSIFVVRGFKIATEAKNYTGRLLAYSCTTFIAFQALLNMFVVTGMLPTKGLPLPFISHGGSSLLISFVVCGILLSISRETKGESSSFSSQYYG